MPMILDFFILFLHFKKISEGMVLEVLKMEIEHLAKLKPWQMKTCTKKLRQLNLQFGTPSNFEQMEILMEHSRLESFNSFLAHILLPLFFAAWWETFLSQALLCCPLWAKRWEINLWPCTKTSINMESVHQCIDDRVGVQNNTYW